VRLLLVEDHAQLAVPIARELGDQHGHAVTWARDPLAAAGDLARERFDVVVADMLFEHLTAAFAARRGAREVSLTGPGPLLITGLHVVRTVRRTRPDGGIVVWTSGEANRRLHLLHAYEALRVRAFCSKSSGDGKADVLDAAIRAAAASRAFVDPVLNAYLPGDGAPTIAETLLRDERRRAIWQALALGHHSREDIARVTGYAQRTVGNAVGGMLDDLRRLDPGLRPGARPLTELVGFASRHWEFLLDDAVRA